MWTQLGAVGNVDGITLGLTLRAGIRPLQTPFHLVRKEADRRNLKQVVHLGCRNFNLEKALNMIARQNRHMTRTRQIIQKTMAL